MIEIQDSALSALRESLLGRMSPKRFAHTVAVEQMVARLCALFCPEATSAMRAAALLHDLTKELDVNGQVTLCDRLGLPVTEEDRMAQKTFHARTAAALIPLEFPSFADPVILEAVRWHTTGHRGMTLTEQLLYLADYIDLSRTFSNCVILRRYFWGAEPEKMGAEDRLRLLRQTLLLSFDMTVRDLLEEGLPVATDTMEARNELLLLLSKT